MDPASLASIAVALLAAKAGEGFAQQIGSDTWGAVQRLYARLREKLSPRDAETLEQLGKTGSDPATVTQLTSRIRDAMAKDPKLRSEIEQLISDTSRNPRAVSLIAEARDNAKQINIGGDNSGEINMS
jgi:hypothetical protein